MLLSDHEDLHHDDDNLLYDDEHLEIDDDHLSEDNIIATNTVPEVLSTPL